MISDTGSTDNTIQVIKDTMTELDIPGEIFEDKWKNFSHNRNLALKHAEGKSDYILIFDADDLLEGTVNWPARFSKECYEMTLTDEYHSTVYQRPLV